MGKRRLASAIEYSPGDTAPVLLAAGRGGRAEDMISLAEQAGVAVVEDAALAALLDSWADGPAKPGDYIPPWCWEAAAGILAFVMRTNNSYAS